METSIRSKSDTLRYGRAVPADIVLKSKDVNKRYKNRDVTFPSLGVADIMLLSMMVGLVNSRRLLVVNATPIFANTVAPTGCSLAFIAARCISLTWFEATLIKISFPTAFISLTFMNG